MDENVRGSGDKPFLPLQCPVQSLGVPSKKISHLLDAQYICSYWHETELERNLDVFPVPFYCYPNRKPLQM